MSGRLPETPLNVALRRAMASASIALALTPLGAPDPANADLLIRTQTRDVEQGESRSGQIWIDGQRMRLEFHDPEQPDERAIVIFRADQKLYWALDARTRSYAQIDGEEIRALGARVRQTRKEMEARLATLPVEQRQVVEKMMGSMLAATAGPAEPEQLRATDDRREIDGRPARRYELTLGDETVGEVWVTPWKAIGRSDDPIPAFGALAAFQRDLMSELGVSAGEAFGSQPFEVFDRIDGYPLLVRRIQAGMPRSETRFEPVVEVESVPGRYEPPPDYQRRPGPGTAR